MPSEICGFQTAFLSTGNPFSRIRRQSKKWPGSVLLAGCDVLVSRYRRDGVAAAEGCQQRFERTVLRFGKRFEIAAFQFDADGKRVALLPPPKRGYAGVVRHVAA